MKLLLYDGSCNLCHWAVQWVKRNSNSVSFQYEPLKSDIAKKLLEKHANLQSIDSIIFLDESGIYVKSEAIFRISAYLKKPWPIIQIFRIFPKGINDGIYSFIAKNRKNWFGTNETCTL